MRRQAKELKSLSEKLELPFQSSSGSESNSDDELPAQSESLSSQAGASPSEDPEAAADQLHDEITKYFSRPSRITFKTINNKITNCVNLYQQVQNQDSQITSICFLYHAAAQFFAERNQPDYARNYLNKIHRLLSTRPLNSYLNDHEKLFYYVYALIKLDRKAEISPEALNLITKYDSEPLAEEMSELRQLFYASSSSSSAAATYIEHEHPPANDERPTKRARLADEEAKQQIEELQAQVKYYKSKLITQKKPEASNAQQIAELEARLASAEKNLAYFKKSLVATTEGFISDIKALEANLVRAENDAKRLAHAERRVRELEEELEKNKGFVDVLRNSLTQSQHRVEKLQQIAAPELQHVVQQQGHIIRTQLNEIEALRHYIANLTTATPVSQSPAALFSAPPDQNLLGAWGPTQARP